MKKFLSMTASRVESQFQTDWDFHPAVSGINFASNVNTSPSLAFQKALGAREHADTISDEDMSAAAEALYLKLKDGEYYEGGRTVKINGRVDKLQYCTTLTITEKAILRNFCSCRVDWQARDRFEDKCGI